MTKSKREKGDELVKGTGEEEAKNVPKKEGLKRGLDDIEQMFDQKKVKLITAKHVSDRKESRAKRLLKGSCPRVPQEQFQSSSSLDWVDDGLGGRYNSDGFTGRVEDGVKVYKAHVLNKPDAGKTDKCPFDCDCCFI